MISRWRKRNKMSTMIKKKLIKIGFKKFEKGRDYIKIKKDNDRTKECWECGTFSI